MVLPITTAPPTGDNSIEIPHTLKRQLGLDESRREWIRLDTANEFEWMGFDVTPSDTYPMVPRPFFETIAKRFYVFVKARKLQKVRR